MTDRAVGVLVTLTDSMRVDDLEEIMALFRLVRGVADVRAVKADDPLSEMSVRMQERGAMRERLIGLLQEIS